MSIFVEERLRALKNRVAFRLDRRNEVVAVAERSLGPSSGIDPAKLQHFYRQRARKRMRGRMRVFIALSVPFCFFVFIAIQLSRTPAFYVERLNPPDDTNQKVLCDAVTQRGAQLLNNIQNGRPWEIQLEERNLNAWLAEDFQANFAESSLPPTVHHPRVAISDDVLWIGFQYRQGPIRTVVQIGLRAWVPKRNVMVIELEGAKAGALPLPTNYVRHVIEHLCYANNIYVQWRRHEGKLAGVLEFPQSAKELVLKKVEIKSKVIEIRGSSGRTPQKEAF